jgi:hypothetical protein
MVVFGSGEPNPRYPDAPIVPRTVLINPVITPIGEEEQLDWEGCLSVPGLRAMVPRWNKVRYTGFDIYGDPIDRTVDGFHARVVQHECDHLWGKLYPMRCAISAVSALPMYCFPASLRPRKTDQRSRFLFSLLCWMQDTTGNVSCILLFFIEGMNALTGMICINFKRPIAANACAFCFGKVLVSTLYTKL